MAKTPKDAESGADTDLSTDATTGVGAGPGSVVASDAELVPIPGAAPVGGLAEAAAALGAPVVPVPVGGPGVGADRVATPTTSVETRPIDPRTADPRGPAAGETRLFADDRTVSGYGPRTVVDPDEIPGTHIMPALAKILRNGRSYEIGEDIELDFRSYEQLVSIGAVQPIHWSTGEPRDLGRGLLPGRR